jgi:hypothetical protein
VASAIANGTFSSFASVWREVGLAAAGGTEQQDVRLGELDLALRRARARVTAGLYALVVVVDRNGQLLLGNVLADHVLVEEIEDLRRLGQLVELQLGGFGELLLDDLVAEVDALVTDVDAGAGDELLHLLLRFATEGALQQITAVSDACHATTLSVSDTGPLAGAFVDATLVRPSLHPLSGARGRFATITRTAPSPAGVPTRSAQFRSSADVERR